MLTDIAIQKLRFDTQTKVMDTAVPGFGILVGKKTKTFFVVTGKERKFTALGRYPEISLKEARILATTQESKSDPKAPQNAILGFLEASERRLKPDTVSQYRLYLSALPDKPVQELTYQDIMEGINTWEGKPFSQNYAWATYRNFLNWCVEHEYINRSPLFRKLPPNKLPTRDRVLSDEELARVWNATEDNTYGRILRLLILTGQRRMEVRNLKPENIQDNTITFHTKGDRINILPITPLMRENLVLPFQFNNWSTASSRFHIECGVVFRHHDLRRTLATKMAQLGISVVTIERILGHSLGRVARIYNRYSYISEMREALLIYEGHILSLTRSSSFLR